MTNKVLAASAPTAIETARRLLLIWQDPASRRFVRVGELDQLVDGNFAFRYLPEAQESGFSPLVQFPDIDRLYLSTRLPSFFANRVMSRSRGRYGEFRHWIGLEEDGSDTPFEVLIRTGGPRATDTFHVVDDLSRRADGYVISRFLASGVRHVPGGHARLGSLREGQELCLRDEPENCTNPRAILLDARDGEPVGYVPDWLVEDVHSLRAIAADFRVIVERVNPEAPSHLQLLCRIEAVAAAKPT